VSISFTEDTLVQQTTADYLDQQLGWRSVHTLNQTNFGSKKRLGIRPGNQKHDLHWNLIYSTKSGEF